ncbi:MAG: 3-dehydroquinate synthase [Phycisphaerales bacterium]|nr:MAG: 3-dehydroquinate synthase [Phycisphaerales bacterium]
MTSRPADAASDRALDFVLRSTDAVTRVEVRSGLLCEFGPLYHRTFDERPAVVITDEVVAGLHLGELADALRAAHVEPFVQVVPPGEVSKTFDQLGQVQDAMARRALGPNVVVVGLGGGVVCDLAGMVAATWIRGVELALVPTTLEACIDACIGGKAAVNLPAGKNLVGVFHPARLVGIDARCLKTLPSRDVRAGLAESIKHALLTDDGFLEWHEGSAGRVLSLDEATMDELIRRNLRIKARIVERDPWERTGERMLLNLGHTIGHAVEAACAFRLRHGECVAIGLAAAARLSAWASLCDRALVDRVDAVLTQYGLALSLAGFVEDRGAPPSQPASADGRAELPQASADGYAESSAAAHGSNAGRTGLPTAGHESAAGLTGLPAAGHESDAGRTGLPAAGHGSDARRTGLSAAVRPESVLDYCRRDKKALAGSLRFVLLEGVGRPVVRSDVPLELVERACRFAIEGD